MVGASNSYVLGSLPLSLCFEFRKAKCWERAKSDEYAVRESNLSFNSLILAVVITDV